MKKTSCTQGSLLDMPTPEKKTPAKPLPDMQKRMSKLERLIEELCPNGVEYKTLGEIGTFVRGNGLQKKDLTDSGVGCIHYGQLYTFYGNVAYKTKSFVSKNMANTLKR